MNPEAQAELNRISALEIEALTPADKSFLFARRSYLGDRGRRKFGDLLKQMEKAAGVKVKEEAKAEKKQAKAPTPPPPAPEPAKDNVAPYVEEDDDEEDEIFTDDTDEDDDEDEPLG